MSVVSDERLFDARCVMSVVWCVVWDEWCKIDGGV